MAMKDGAFASPYYSIVTAQEIGAQPLQQEKSE